MEVAKNSKARFEYEIIEEFEAGIVLTGSEVKSMRLKKASIVDSYGVIKGNEVFLINMRVEPYLHGHHFNHEPVRSRKLLLHKNEISRLKSKLAEKGWALIPLKIYFKENRTVKILLGLCRGKKLHDKRQSIKDKDLSRDAMRELKSYK
ncbi:MAG: SsrA-binding protein SmpB [Spirochaetia bacterium]|nr:SsrA-binding protein SmpB [Spirochaetia bacterium]